MYVIPFWYILWPNTYPLGANAVKIYDAIIAIGYPFGYEISLRCAILDLYVKAAYKERDYGFCNLHCPPPWGT